MTEFFIYLAFVAVLCTLIGAFILLAKYFNWQQRVGGTGGVEHGIILYDSEENEYMKPFHDTDQKILIYADEPYLFCTREVLDLVTVVSRASFDRTIGVKEILLCKVERKTVYSQEFFNDTSVTEESIDWSNPLPGNEFHDYFVPWVKGEL